jgi:hypothetical protein
MIFPLFTLFALSVTAEHVVETATALLDDKAPGMSTLVVTCDDPHKVGKVYVTEAKSGDHRHVVVPASEEHSGLPDVWIGVRLTPVPAPLAAHIGEQGVMISNVVKGSPADKAGVERYDVVVAFGNREIKGPQDLTDAVGTAEAGKSVKLAVIRKGNRQEIGITPAKRPAEFDQELKYEEPAESFVDEAVKLYGKTLTFGPDGKWIMRDLGTLKHWPDALDALKDLDLDIKLDLSELRGLDDLDRKLDLRILRELDEGEAEETGEDRDVRIELRLQVDQDGQCCTIVRDPDGKIHVTRKDAAGHESSATYDDADQLEQADPDAHRLYHRHAGDSRQQIIRIRPPGNRVGQWRQQFQIDVEKKVQEALERAKQTYEDAQEKAEQARREAWQKADEVRILRRADKGPERGADKETLIVRVDEKGAIHVTVVEGNRKTSYEFESKDDFKASEPDLYERVEGSLD